MKQIVLIGGGTTFPSQEEYLAYLSTKEVRLDRIAYQPKWKEGLQQALGAGYQVLIPSMPNTTNAKYTEWELYFTRVCEVLEDGCVLIGHSLGGIFLANYLSKHPLPFKPAATILLAAPFRNEDSESLGDFKLDGLSDLFSEQAGAVHIIGAYDDPVIAPADFDAYKAVLPQATAHEISAPDHYVRSAFPELVSLIREGI